jgi:hypothetical protein
MVCTVNIPEAEFLDVQYLGQKSQEFSSLLFTVTSTDGTHTTPLEGKSRLKLVCNVNIVHGNLKSEASQDYAQKPQ